MNENEIAQKLNGSQYPLKISGEIQNSAKEAGIVIIYGSSDDLIELRGVVTDEGGVFGGGSLRIDKKGILPEWDAMMDRSPSEEEVCQYFERKKESVVIEALWDNEGYSFTYRTAVPHVTFEVLEGTDKYCRGIVFSLNDLPNTARDSEQ